MDKKIMVVGNWKMHLTVHQASLLLHRLQTNIKIHRDLELVLAPSMLSLQPLSLEVDRRKFRLCAQDAYYKDEGDFTGEVSFAMLDGLIHYALVGHSSRRIYAGETLDMVRDKVQAAIRNNIVPIVCFGETKREREAGETKRVLYDQVTTALMNVTSADLEQVVLVYEPVWAITTFDGIMAKPHQVSDAVKYIRMQVGELFGNAAARKVRVLYGGSVNQHDVVTYVGVKGVDGVLVGAASLNYREFTAIVEAIHTRNTVKVRART